MRKTSLARFVSAIIILTSVAGCKLASTGKIESANTLVATAENSSQQLPLEVEKKSPPPEPPAKSTSLLEQNTLLTIYGRGFGIAPILGHLGTYEDLNSMAKDIDKWIEPIKKNNDQKGVIPAIHLIYAMAIPCKPESNCLLYLNGKTDEIISKYIEPAAARGWAVILDTQLGRSTPVEQVNRMIERGYLKYDNVHVAIDPEFHSHPGHDNPGIPIGTIESKQINEVQRILDDYVKANALRTKKILIVHQFGDPNVNDGVPFMIQNKKELKTFDRVDLVVDMDGFGGQEIKVFKYNKITDDDIYPFIRFRGIKIFYPNQWEKHGHYDKPPMDMDQIFGIKPIKKGLKMENKPDVIIIA